MKTKLILLALALGCIAGTADAKKKKSSYDYNRYGHIQWLHVKCTCHCQCTKPHMRQTISNHGITF